MPHPDGATAWLHRVVTTCRGCGRDVPVGARFCPACGASQQAVHDERRVATVVIGDMVGFTGLSEHADPERVKALVDGCLARLADVVRAHGGTVDKIMGDAILSLFGAPVAHEDDPERAVRAALAMQSSVTAYASQREVPLQMRVAVTTGEVLVGRLRAGDDYTAMGDAVNLASRLQADAAPGEVLVEAGTARATRHAIAYEQRGERAVRGRAASVEVWAALRALGPPGARSSRRAGPLVGRAGELALLDATVDAVVARRRAHVVYVTGDAGVGKRRLVDAVAERAAARHGALVVQGQCAPYGEGSVWAPIAAMLREAVGSLDEDDETAAVAIAAEVLGVEPTDPMAGRVAGGLRYLLGEGDALAGDGDVARIQAEAVDAVLALVAHVTASRPVLTVLADAQWADDAVVAFLDRALQRLRRHPVLALVTVRGTLPPSWDAPPEDVSVTRLHLPPLQDGDATTLARALLGDRDVPDGVVVDVARRSGGNPLFLEEFASLAAEGAVLTEGTRLEDLPATLRALAAARLDALPVEDRLLIEDAAVVGRSGMRGVVLALAGARGVPDAARVFDALVDREILVVAGDEYTFKADVVRDVAYLALPKAERVRRHEFVGDLLQDFGPARDGAALQRRAQHLATAAELLAELGHVGGIDHDLPQRAVDALAAAASWTQARDATASVELWDRALALVPPGSTARRLALVLGRAEAHAAAGRHEDAEADADTVLRATASGPVRARALTVLGEIEQRRGDLDRSLEHLRAAVDLARACDDRDALAVALHTLGMTAIFQGDHDLAESVVTEALGVYRATGHRRGQGWAEQNLGWIAFNRGDADGALRWVEASTATFEALQDWGAQAFATGLRGWVRYLQGRLEEAQADARAALALAGEPAGTAATGFGLGLVHVLLCATSLWQGCGAEAVRHGESAVDLLHRAGHRWGEMVATLTVARALQLRGEPAAARRALERGLAIAAALSGPRIVAFGAVIAASIALEAGEGTDVAGLGPDVVGSPPPIDALRLGALAALQEGDVTEARRLSEAALAGASTAGISAAARAVHSLAAAARGDRGTALRDAEALAADPAATYVDRATAWTATALAHRAKGARDDAAAALERARDAVAPTDDRLHRAVIELAAALVEDRDVAPARQALHAVGVTGDGWETALRAALG